MKWLQQYRWALFGITLLWCGYALTLWFGAQGFEPRVTPSNQVNALTFNDKPYEVPAERYDRMRRGELFFGGSSGETTTEIIFKSPVIVWGITRGRENRAVISMDANQSETWIVKPGDEVNGERIVAITDRYVVIRNQTGEGKVYMTE